MATSVTKSGLIAAADKVILAARPEVELLKLFSTDFSPASARKGDGVAVEVMSATASDFAANNGYTKSTNGIKPVTVPLNQHKKSTYTVGDIDALENELAPCWGNFAPTAGKAVAKAAVTYAVGQFDYANRKDYVTKNPSTLADFADLRAMIVGKDFDPADGILLLTPTYYAKLLAVVPQYVAGTADPIRRAQLGEMLGFKAVIESPNCKTASGAAESGVTPSNGFGFFAPTGSLAIAARCVTPVMAGGNLIEFGTIQDEETGFVFGTRVVVDADQGTCSWNVDSLFGAKLARVTGDDDYDNGAPGYLQLLKA